MSAPTGAGEPAMCAATPSLVGRSSPRGRATDMEFFGRDLEVAQGVVGSVRTAQSHDQDAGGSGPILEGLIPQIIAGCTGRLHLCGPREDGVLTMGVGRLGRGKGALRKRKPLESTQ